jgi:hypothetical protein
VIVAVDVVGPVIVAVHVHGNDTLIVIRPVEGGCVTARVPAFLFDEHRRGGLELLERVVAMLVKRSNRDRQGESITITVSFPCTCTAGITGAITSTNTDIDGSAAHCIVNHCFPLATNAS